MATFGAENHVPVPLRRYWIEIEEANGSCGVSHCTCMQGKTLPSGLTMAVFEPDVADGTDGAAVGVAVMAAGGSGAGVEQPARTAARHAHTVTASTARGTRASGDAVMPAIITNQ